MKNSLRKIFSFILILFESGCDPYVYKPSHRVVLIVVGILFSFLATAVFFIAQGKNSGYFLPVIVFGTAGLVSLIVGLIGNNRAVAKIWGSR